MRFEKPIDDFRSGSKSIRGSGQRETAQQAGRQTTLSKQAHVFIPVQPIVPNGEAFVSVSFIEAGPIRLAFLSGTLRMHVLTDSFA